MGGRLRILGFNEGLRDLGPSPPFRAYDEHAQLRNRKVKVDNERAELAVLLAAAPKEPWRLKPAERQALQDVRIRDAKLKAESNRLAARLELLRHEMRREDIGEKKTMDRNFRLAAQAVLSPEQFEAIQARANEMDD